MEPFINRVVKDLLEKYATDFDQLVVVLPSRRACTFFKHFVGKNRTSPIWLPRIVSIEDFVYELTKLQPLSAMQLTLEFYQAYRVIEAEKAEDLDQFLKWAPTMLADFSELDAYLINPQKFFSYLKDIRAIEIWNPENTVPTQTQVKYLEFWEKMGEYYQEFRTRLLTNNKAYQGLAFRYLVENLSAIYTEQNNENGWLGNQVVFAGFNAINAAEEAIISFLIKEGKADLYWDADAYYLHNEIHEAGLFLRRFQKKWGKLNWVEENFKAPKKVEIYSVSGDIGQAKFTNELLKLATDEQPTNTALVLADENLLLPVLNHLPENIEKVNVTMGYPVKLSPLFTLLLAVIDLHSGGQKMTGKSDLYYHRDFEKLLRQPVLLEQETIAFFAQIILSEIARKNHIFISENLLVNYFDKYPELEALEKLLRPLNNGKELIERLKQWLNYLTPDNEKKDLLEIEYHITLTRLLNQLDEVLLSYDVEVSIRTIRQLFQQLVGQESIPFRGEPLGGLQIMGVLETRLLDFDKVIMLSVNEGTLPAGKKQNSFIPYDVKYQFGLPTHHEKDAVFAYHFYRLCQRASELSLVYNEEVDGFSTGEASRFVLQLQRELPTYNPAVELMEQTIQIPVPPIENNAVVIPKNEAVFQSIASFFQRGVSPSSINSYLLSPLDFYYQNIVKLYDEDSVEEDIEDSSFGSILHEVLEELYKDELNHELTPEVILAKKAKVTKLLKANYEKVYGRAYKTGEIWLSYNVSLKYLNDFLEFDAERVRKLIDAGQSVVILELEEKMVREMEFYGHAIVFKGTADRVEKVGDSIWILDYKSGMVQQKDLSVRDEEKILNGEYGKVVQLMMYAWLYEPKLKEQEEVVAGILSLRNMKAGVLSLAEKKGSIALGEEVLMRVFEKVISELLNPDISFERPLEYQYPLFE